MCENVVRLSFYQSKTKTLCDEAYKVDDSQKFYKIHLIFHTALVYKEYDINDESNRSAEYLNWSRVNMKTVELSEYFASLLVLALIEGVYSVPSPSIVSSLVHSLSPAWTTYTHSSHGHHKHHEKEDIKKHYYASPDKANYFQAYLNCLSAGMELATVENEQESDVLDRILKNNLREGYWLAGNNLADPDTQKFYWISTGRRVTYTNWGKNQPKNGVKKGSCIRIGMSGRKISWSNFVCDNILGYVCQTRKPCRKH